MWLCIYLRNHWLCWLLWRPPWGWEKRGGKTTSGRSTGLTIFLLAPCGWVTWHRNQGVSARPQLWQSFSPDAEVNTAKGICKTSEGIQHEDTLSPVKNTNHQNWKQACHPSAKGKRWTVVLCGTFSSRIRSPLGLKQFPLHLPTATHTWTWDRSPWLYKAPSPFQSSSSFLQGQSCVMVIYKANMTQRFLRKTLTIIDCHFLCLQLSVWENVVLSCGLCCSLSLSSSACSEGTIIESPSAQKKNAFGRYRMFPFSAGLQLPVGMWWKYILWRPGAQQASLCLGWLRNRALWTRDKRALVLWRMCTSCSPSQTLHVSIGCLFFSLRPWRP